MSNSYESFRQYEVSASSVADFLERYTKHSAHRGRGEDYATCRIASCATDIERHGFCFITHHDSKTGEIVAYYPTLK